MTEIVTPAVVNGIPVVPGTVLAAIAAVIPKELLVAVPTPTLTALASLPVTAIAEVMPELAGSGAAFDKALLAINSTAAAAQAATATLALNHAIMSAAKLKP